MTFMVIGSRRPARGAWPGRPDHARGLSATPARCRTCVMKDEGG